MEKATKMWEGINRCLGKQGTEEIHDLPKSHRKLEIDPKIESRFS